MESWAVLVPVLAFFVAVATLGNGVIRMIAVATGKTGIKDAGEAFTTLLTGLISSIAFIVARNVAADNGFEYPPLVTALAVLIALAIIGVGLWGGLVVASRTNSDVGGDAVKIDNAPPTSEDASSTTGTSTEQDERQAGAGLRLALSVAAMATVVTAVGASVVAVSLLGRYKPQQ